MNIDKEYEIEKIDTLQSTVSARMENDIFTMRMLCTLQNKEISTLFDLLDNYRRILNSKLNEEQRAFEPVCKIVFDIPYYFCGHCHEMLNMYSTKAMFCSKCGRPVKWSAVKE